MMVFYLIGGYAAACPGDLFGIRQSGQFQFQLGDIYQDAVILQDAQCCAAKKYMLPIGSPTMNIKHFGHIMKRMLPQILTI